MVKRLLAIAHISDLHIGGATDTELETQLGSILAEATPTFLICSGDIINRPSTRYAKQAAELLRRLQDKCRIPAERIIVAAGNHDYKSGIGLGAFAFRRIPFEMYFRHSAAELSWRPRVALYFRLLLQSFLRNGGKLRPRMFSRHDPDYPLDFYVFDSTPVLDRLMLATGKVDGTQINGFVNDAKANGKDGWRLRVAVVHHHPLPLANVPSELPDRVQESFLIFQNAGTFLREIGRRGVQVVLHGHKHIAGYARLEYELPDGSLSRTAIVGAGSALLKSPGDARGNELNLLNLMDDGTASVTQWFYSNEVMKKDETTDYPLIRLQDLSREHSARSQRRVGFSVEVVKRHVTITAHGYSRIRESMVGCRVVRAEGVESYCFPEAWRKTPPPAYIRNPRVVTPTSGKVNTKSVSLREVELRLEFQPALLPSDGRFNIEFEYLLLNGHATNAKEFRRKYRGQLDAEYSTIEAPEGADRLELTVTLENVAPKNIAMMGAVAKYCPFVAGGGRGPEQTHDRETARLRNGITQREKETEFSVVVDAPAPGFLYRLQWQYCDAASPVAGQELEEAGLELARKTLLALSPSADPESVYARIEGHLRKVAAALEKRCPVQDPKEVLDVSLAVLDDSQGLLRVIAASYDRPAKDRHVTFASGEGCAGFAFEKQDVVFYDRSKEDEIGYYIDPGEVDQSEGDWKAHEVLLVVPWTEGKTSVPMGVLNIGSRTRASRLRWVFESPGRKEGEKVTLQSLTRVLGASILAELGLSHFIGSPVA